MIDIISALDRTVDPDAVAALADGSGGDAAAMRGAIPVALPAVLAMLSGMGSTVPGAGRIFDAMRDGPAPRDLAALLGEDEMRSLAQALAGHTGIGEGETTVLADMLGAVALDVLGGEVERRQMGKTELSRFLREQRAAIMDALPPRFARHVSGSRYFDAFLTGFAFDGTAPMTVTGSTAPAMLAEASRAGTTGKPTAMRLAMAVVLAVLTGACLFYAVGAISPESPPPAGPPAGIERGAP